MNKVIEKAIKKAYHSLDRIKSIHVADNGLFINDIAFRPFVPKVVIDSLPIDIRQEVARGNILEFFDFLMLYKMRNLNTLVIDNVRFAETRVRKELNLKRTATWDTLYDEFPNLQYLEIGGSRITTPEEAQHYEERGKGDFEFQDRLREAFSFDGDLLDRVKSPVKKLWKSKPVAIITGALGGTVGTQVVFGMASLMGAWGILFAGLSGYGAYNTYIRGNRTGGGQRSHSRDYSEDLPDDFGDSISDVRGAKKQSGRRK